MVVTPVAKIAKLNKWLIVRQLSFFQGMPRVNLSSSEQDFSQEFIPLLSNQTPTNIFL